MKKRCTNSACRKVFTAGPFCPYCGKEYPRVQISDPPLEYWGYAVYLDSSGSKKNKVIEALVHMGLDTYHAGFKVRHTSIICCKSMTREDAKGLCGALRKAGASAKVLYPRNRRCAKG